ncbi:hypothetical protein CLOP_g17686, partial [Closterium sp. NIES-67]
IKDRV